MNRASAAQAGPMFSDVELLTRACVAWLRLGVELRGALVIAIGLAMAIAGLVHHGRGAGGASFNPVRLQLARYLALALELQQAVDILSTAIAPGWAQIGKLAAIAVIRTGMHYFLMLEMKRERGQRVREEGEHER